MIAAVYAHLRAVNVALTALVLLGMACRWPAFARASWPSKVGRLVVLWWVLVNGYGTLEAAAASLRPGYRVPAITTALLLTCYYLAADWAADRRDRQLAAAVAACLARDSARDPAPAG